MASIIVFEDFKYEQFLPLSYWRPVFELRCGYGRLIDRAAHMLRQPIDGAWARDWIAGVAESRQGLPVNGRIDDQTLLINARWLIPAQLDFEAGPHAGMIEGELAYVSCDAELARRMSPELLLDSDATDELLESIRAISAPGSMIEYPWDLLSRLDEQLQEDWRTFSGGSGSSAEAPPQATAPERIYIDARAVVHATAVLDASAGSIYVGPEAQVGPLSVIEGPCYLGPSTRIRPHAHLHGTNAIGPACKIGGEVDACIIDGYSNKQHHGYLGHSVVGSWVNLGAGTVNSDLKNTYGSVRCRLPSGDVDTGTMFFGAVIADHVKTAINTAIPTGASIGTATVVASSGPTQKYIPPFMWFTDAGEQPGDPEQLLKTARKAMGRRGVTVTPEEEELFLYIARQFGGFAPS